MPKPYLSLAEHVEIVHQLVNERRRRLGRPPYDFSLKKQRKRQIRDYKHRRELFAEMCAGLGARISAAGCSTIAGLLGIRPGRLKGIIQGSVPNVALAKKIYQVLEIDLPAEIKQLDFSRLKDIRKRKRISLRDLALVFDSKTHVILFLEQGSVDRVDLVTAVEVARWLKEQTQ